MNNEQLWQAVLGEIELNLSKANFTTWFKNSFIYSFENKKLIIAVPNIFTRTWLEKKYNKDIAAAIKNITGEEVKEFLYKIEAKKNSFFSPISSVETHKESENITAAKSLVNRFGLNYRYTFENFIVGKGNELAHAACQAIVANPGVAYNPLFIYGGAGLGKTHLLQGIGHKFSKITDKILYVSCEKFTNDYIQAVRSGHANTFKNLYRNVDLLLIDDIQFMGGKDGTQQEFFHTFNELHQINKQIVVSSDRPPKAIPALEKRLLSRFEWGMIADVAPPDYETKIAILEAKCREKNYILEQEILSFIANNIQDNIRELEGALNRLIAFYEFNNCKPSVETAQNILNSVIENYKSKSVTPKTIIEAAAKYFDINTKDLIGQCRKKELVVPRQIVMYLIREEINASYPTIGQELGGRDHTTAMHAFNKIRREIKEDNKIRHYINSIKQILRENC